MVRYSLASTSGGFDCTDRFDCIDRFDCTDRFDCHMCPKRPSLACCSLGVGPSTGTFLCVCVCMKFSRASMRALVGLASLYLMNLKLVGILRNTPQHHCIEGGPCSTEGLLYIDHVAQQATPQQHRSSTVLGFRE